MRKFVLILSVILITGLTQSFTTIPESKGVTNDEMITQINDLTASVQSATMDIFMAEEPDPSAKLEFHISPLFVNMTVYCNNDQIDACIAGTCMAGGFHHVHISLNVSPWPGFPMYMELATGSPRQCFEQMD